MIHKLKLEAIIEVDDSEYDIEAVLEIAKTETSMYQFMDFDTEKGSIKVIDKGIKESD